MNRRKLTGWVLAGMLVVGGTAALAGSPGATARDAPANGARMVRGEIARVNEAKGTLTLKTKEGDVDVQLPPGVVKGLRKGDRLTVRLAVHAAASTADPAKRPSGAPRTP